MNKCVIVIDNSNVWIEGQKFSAGKKGVVKASAEEKDICDPSWRIDFGNLLHEVSEGKEIIKAILVGSRPPQSDTIWKAAENYGFDVFVHDRNSSGKEKAVDTEIVAQGTEVICTEQNPAIFKLLSGDRDFIPLINMANKRKWETEMWAFTNSFTSVGQMAQSVTRIIPETLKASIVSGKMKQPCWQVQ
jgi:uncharacterized LabA/DUF88 family protein